MLALLFSTSVNGLTLDGCPFQGRAHEPEADQCLTKSRWATHAIDFIRRQILIQSIDRGFTIEWFTRIAVRGGQEDVEPRRHFFLESPRHSDQFFGSAGFPREQVKSTPRNNLIRESPFNFNVAIT